jgi:riboflavin kinase/FMN adenylyltransferase
MNVIFGLDRVAPSWQECTVAVGHFDGVHWGHRGVIAEAVRDAWRSRRPAVVVTFDRNPAEIVRPAEAPPYLCTLGQRLERIAQLGVDHAIVTAFTKAFSQHDWLWFVQHVLQRRLRCAHLVVGEDFRFGHGREGSAETIRARRDELALAVTSVPLLNQEGRRISSTEIRSAVAAGDVTFAERWLGRPYSLVGTVERGDGRGRKLGWPTVNLTLVARLVVPAEGVYAGRASCHGNTWDAAISIGTRPSVGGTPMTIEAHLLDYSGPDLYGRTVTVEFRARLREQRDLGSLEALGSQIAADVEQCRAVLRDLP